MAGGVQKTISDNVVTASHNLTLRQSLLPCALGKVIIIIIIRNILTNFHSNITLLPLGICVWASRCSQFPFPGSPQSECCASFWSDGCLLRCLCSLPSYYFWLDPSQIRISNYLCDRSRYPLRWMPSILAIWCQAELWWVLW